MLLGRRRTPTTRSFAAAACDFVPRTRLLMARWPVFLPLRPESSSRRPDATLSSQGWSVHISARSVPPLFILFTRSFAEQKLFILMRSVYLFCLSRIVWSVSWPRILHQALGPEGFLLRYLPKDLQFYVERLNLQFISYNKV